MMIFQMITKDPKTAKVVEDNFSFLPKEFDSWKKKFNEVGMHYQHNGSSGLRRWVNGLRNQPATEVEASSLEYAAALSAATLLMIAKNQRVTTGGTEGSKMHFGKVFADFANAIKSAPDEGKDGWASPKPEWVKADVSPAQTIMGAAQVSFSNNKSFGFASQRPKDSLDEYPLDTKALANYVTEVELVGKAMLENVEGKEVKAASSPSGKIVIIHNVKTATDGSGIIVDASISVTGKKEPGSWNLSLLFEDLNSIKLSPIKSLDFVSIVFDETEVKGRDGRTTLMEVAVIEVSPPDHPKHKYMVYLEDEKFKMAKLPDEEVK